MQKYHPTPIMTLSLYFKTFFRFRVRILFAGDDVTDEDAMKALKGMAISFRIVNNHVCNFVYLRKGVS